MLDGEGEWLSAVVANLADDHTKLVYADWLQEQGDNDRAAFLRAFVAASRTMKASDFPEPREEYGEEWLELIGFRLLERAAREGFPELKGPMLKLARPALRMKKEPMPAADLPAGASKIGGRPDLPVGYAWPKGEECKAIYNDDTEGVERLAGFLGQINFAEIAHTQAMRDLPKNGLLSFFSFQEDDDPDTIGVQVVYFPDSTGFVPTEPPNELTAGNEELPLQRLMFEETLDLPETDGPWKEELQPHPGVDYSDVFEYFRRLNFNNFLGYARATGNGDRTPSKAYRHLILLKNSWCRLHLQLRHTDLLVSDFDKVELVYVNFD